MIYIIFIFLNPFSEPSRPDDGGGQSHRGRGHTLQDVSLKDKDDQSEERYFDLR